MFKVENKIIFHILDKEKVGYGRQQSILSNQQGHKFIAGQLKFIYVHTEYGINGNERDSFRH